MKIIFKKANLIKIVNIKNRHRFALGQRSSKTYRLGALLPLCKK